MTCRKLLFSSPLACGGNHTRCALAITHHHTGSAISEQVARNIRPGAFSNKRLLLQICVKKCVWWSAEQIFDQMARKQPCLVVHRTAEKTFISEMEPLKPKAKLRQKATSPLTPRVAMPYKTMRRG